MGNLTVREVVTDVIAKVAPDELPLLAGLEPIDDAGADRVLTRRARGRDPLGFGLDTVVSLVTPVLWIVLTDVAREGVTNVAMGVLARMKRRLRRWLNRRRPMTLPPLDPAQVRHVRSMILTRCAAAGIDDARAAQVADAVAVRLMLGTASGDAREGSTT